MCICSLLPSATETVFALGLGHRLVGVSHTCDYPEEATGLPVLTQDICDVCAIGSNTVLEVVAKALEYTPQFLTIRATGLWTAGSVELAGGVHGLVKAGEHSRRVGWEEVASFAPEVVLVTPCGYGLDQSRAELAVLGREPAWSSLPAVQAGEVYVFDGHVPSRHGPRAVDVLEAMADILHPEDVQERRWSDVLYERAP